MLLTWATNGANFGHSEQMSSGGAIECRNHFDRVDPFALMAPQRLTSSGQASLAKWSVER